MQKVFLCILFLLTIASNSVIYGFSINSDSQIITIKEKSNLYNSEIQYEDAK